MGDIMTTTPAIRNGVASAGRYRPKGPGPMNGATIQEHPCPRCANRRTVQIASASFCFNCRLYWGSQWSKVSGAAVESRQEPPYPFTAAETARLTMYRAAIHAGFYSDQSAPRRCSASATSSGCGACTLVGSVAACQRMSAANKSVIDAQLSEWLAPERR